MGIFALNCNVMAQDDMGNVGCLLLARGKASQMMWPVPLQESVNYDSLMRAQGVVDGPNHKQDTV